MPRTLSRIFIDQLQRVYNGSVLNAVSAVELGIEREFIRPAFRWLVGNRVGPVLAGSPRMVVFSKGSSLISCSPPNLSRFCQSCLLRGASAATGVRANGYSRGLFSLVPTVRGIWETRHPTGVIEARWEHLLDLYQLALHFFSSSCKDAREFASSRMHLGGFMTAPGTDSSASNRNALLPIRW